VDRRGGKILPTRYWVIVVVLIAAAIVYFIWEDTSNGRTRTGTDADVAPDAERQPSASAYE